MEPSDRRGPDGGGLASGLSDRLRQVYRLLGGQERVADCIGVAKGTPGRWVRGESRMLLEDAAKICTAADVSLEWLAFGGALRTGEGDWVESGAVYDAAELILELTKELEQSIEPVKLARTIRDRAKGLTHERYPQSDGSFLTKTTDR